MSQIKVYGIKDILIKRRERLSEVLHSCTVDALKFPPDKKFHRFFPMEKENFMFPAGRTENYTIIEISMFEGRSIETKKEFINLIYSRFKKELGIEENDIEITIFETPKCNWGIRGKPGDELALSYKVNV